MTHNSWRLAIIMLFAFVSPIMAKQKEANTKFVPIRIEAVAGWGVTIDHIDGVQYIDGEIVQISLGRHIISAKGPYHSRLEAELEVSSPEEVRIISSEVRQECMDYEQPLLQVTNWESSVFTVDGLAILVIQGPTVKPRRDEFKLCPSACCGWDMVKNIVVEFSSLPEGAMILANGKRVGNTGVTLSIPYGVSRGGEVEDVILRVVRSGYIGCTYHLKQFITNQKPTINCQLRKIP